MATPMEANGIGASSSSLSANLTQVMDKSLSKIDTTEYTLRKRLPRRLPKRTNDVYISNQTDFKAQHARCQKLLDSGASEIYIHGLGAAVNRAVNLALQLQKTSLYTLELSVNTSTVELTDDLEARTDGAEPATRERNNSAVHIKLTTSGEISPRSEAQLRRE